MTFKDELYKAIDECNSDDCLEWWGWIHDGYGLIKIEQKRYYVHRLSYERVTGLVIEKGKVIRHSCDNRKCFNPKHLSIGTHADNVNDRVTRGRSASGTRNGRSKLTEKQVIEIFQSKDKQSSLSKKYSVDPSVIRGIRNGLKWKTVTDKLTKQEYNNEE